MREMRLGLRGLLLGSIAYFVMPDDTGAGSGSSGDQMAGGGTPPPPSDGGDPNAAPSGEPQAAPTPPEPLEGEPQPAVAEDLPEPAVDEPAPARVPQIGDTVVVHGRAIIDGMTSANAKVIKVRDDGTLAVRVTKANGTPYDVPGNVYDHDLGTGEFYYSWPVDGDQA